MSEEKVAIQGVAGSFHDLAARRFFAPKKIALLECETFEQVCQAVQTHEATAGVMAIENTIAGSLLPNYALLQTHRVSIVGEVYVRIQHNLLALPNQTLADIKVVQAHPMALLQCREFFKQYPHIRLEEAFDTAGIARKIHQEQLKGVGAIAGYYAAELYGLQVLAEGLESNHQNFTRFLVLSRRANPLTRQFNKASLGFRVAHTSGSLAEALLAFKRNGINLTKIQSIPIVGVPYEYTILVDVVWNDVTDFEQALREFKPCVLEYKIYGVYCEGEKNIDLTTRPHIRVEEPQALAQELGKKVASGEVHAKPWQTWLPSAPSAPSDYIIISGPCSAETEAQVRQAAHALASKNITKILRAGVWKPRTRAGGFEGNGVKALEWLANIKAETGLQLAVEVATAEHVEACLKYGVDIVWIGARTTGNPFSVQEIADAVRGTTLGVMVKNPISPDLELWIGAIERLYFAGVNKLVAIHRGFSTHEKTLYRNNPLWSLALQFRTRLAHVPLICDPSHIAGKRELVPAVAQKAIDLGMNGLMIEAHPCPTSAWTDAAQQLTPDALAELLSSLKWKPKPDSHEQDTLDRLRAAIDRLDEEFVEIMAARMNLAREIGVFKKLNRLELYQPARWKEILDKRKAQGTKLSLSETFIEQLYEYVHQESLRVQSEVMGDPMPNQQKRAK